MEENNMVEKVSETRNITAAIERTEKRSVEL